MPRPMSNLRFVPRSTALKLNVVGTSKIERREVQGPAVSDTSNLGIIHLHRPLLKKNDPEAAKRTSLPIRSCLARENAHQLLISYLSLSNKMDTLQLLDIAYPYILYAEKTLFGWEYLFTVDDEFDLFWSSKLSWIKCLFFVNRYLNIAFGIWDMISVLLSFLRTNSSTGTTNTAYYFVSLTMCNGIASLPSFYLCILAIDTDSAFYATIQILVMECILILRVWAMAGRKRNLLRTFCFLLLLNVAATLGICFSIPTQGLGLTMYSWLPMLLFELIVFLFAAFYGVRGVKATKILTQIRQNFGPKPIMGLLLRDSVFNFLIVLCCLPILEFVDCRMGLNFMSITITRMLLRLRKRAKADLTMPRSQDMERNHFE
ncbi:uncharacterized protein ARMOST_15475 [Armillaria ostoyae]|uniref:DUF6533 domain-containing protein n=1 Tax=Armillaria ostoyae TaxID=47428 RepID=A0A284RTM5_ARMOS|nr:uncharacterized protein ARMOST_15475 [Armillaria ostoyae]